MKVTESIIVAIITGVLTLVGVLIANSRSDAVQTERIEQLRKDLLRVETKQDKHNQLMERTFKLEETTALHDAELKRVNHRLENLEKEVK